MTSSVRPERKANVRSKRREQLELARARREARAASSVFGAPGRGGVVPLARGRAPSLLYGSNAAGPLVSSCPERTGADACGVAQATVCLSTAQQSAAPFTCHPFFASCNCKLLVQRLDEGSPQGERRFQSISMLLIASE